MKFIKNNRQQHLTISIVALISYIIISSSLIINSQAYFLTDSAIEQIEQKYETTIDDHMNNHNNHNNNNEPLQALSNDQSSQQIDHQHQHQQQQQQQSSSMIIDSISSAEPQQQQQQQQQQSSSLLTTNEQNRLNEIYNRLANQAQLLPHNDDTQTSASNYDEQSSQSAAAGYGMYQNQEGISKITQIPQGSMFTYPDKNGKLEFESMYAKQPYSIVFRTQSMPVKIKQQHQTLPAPEVEFVRSQEEAHRIKHEVIRPVIQEVHEIIQPYRRVVQEVRPVIENVHTIVAKGEPRHGGAGGSGGGVGGMGKTTSRAGHGSGGGYPDNMSGSYSEQRIRFMALPSDDMDTEQHPHSHQHAQSRLTRQQHLHHPHIHSHHHQQQHHSKNYRGTAMTELRPQNNKPIRYIQRRYWDRY
ncbi:dfp2-like protein [Dermatophagoides farinae]|uniref:Dfp2-like protein n=1 Tax=Dermatophagoides farinae TaxID=6954 RepID=A0A9D4P772_DERFA|nr:dfp2-like protein [Dermatophagoides farinae]